LPDLILVPKVCHQDHELAGERHLGLLIRAYRLLGKGLGNSQILEVLATTRRAPASITPGLAADFASRASR
jgi:hypothetical protein